MKFLLSSLFILVLACIPPVAKAAISDNELRELFILTGEDTSSHKYGGIVFFKGYFDKHKTACEYKTTHPNTTIFIDQEGGSVVRIPDAAPPSPAEAQHLSYTEFYKLVQNSAKKLKSDCIDANLAPVVEVSHDSSRYYGDTMNEVISKSKTFSLAMESEGIKTVLKHFPAWKDNCISTFDLDSIKLKLRKNSEARKCTVSEDEKNMFYERANLFKDVPSDAWMVSNNIIVELGPYPSTMNPVIHDFIRGQLAYNGLLISDALWEIEASPKAILMSLKVVDWIMVGYSSQAEEAIPLIQSGLQTGLFTEQELRDKIKKIEAFKTSKNHL